MCDDNVIINACSISFITEYPLIPRSNEHIYEQVQLNIFELLNEVYCPPLRFNEHKTVRSIMLPVLQAIHYLHSQVPVVASCTSPA